MSPISWSTHDCGRERMSDAALSLPLVASEQLESPPRRALRRLFRRKGALVGLIVIAAFIVLAAFAPLLTPYDPVATSWTLVRKPPSALHWFGTDDLGRDILVRVIYGARASLSAGGDRGWHRAPGRRATRTAIGLSGRLYRWPDQPHNRRHAGLPVPDPGHRTGRVSRPESRQRHDRDRHLDDADLR